MSEENDFHFDGASEVNREVSRLIGAPKTHVNPRIDAVWFQAEIPEFDVDGVRSKGTSIVIIICTVISIRFFLRR